MGPSLAVLGVSFAVLLVALVITCIQGLGHLPKVRKKTVAFFHPFADGGGGGERVLWCAVRAVQQACPHAKVVIFVREGPTAQDLVVDASARFDIIVSDIEVVPLNNTAYILPEKYSRFTLLRQAIGSVYLAWEALTNLVPEVFIDTTGWAFPYPLVRLAGSRVACYVHYPTVSADMVNRVWLREANHVNDDEIAESMLKTTVKVVYYQAMAVLYGLVGAFPHVVMVNSSWTAGHIRQLWWRWREPALVYPPCDTESLQRLPLDRRLKRLFLVSVAQFRPEKNHRLQLEAYALARKRAGNDLAGHAVRVSRLKLVGSCRNAADAARLGALRAYAGELGVGEHVDWEVDLPHDQLRTLLGGAVGGLHTMRDEHFGISVVEYMAAGVIPIAHNSGGPREDIVVMQPGGEDGKSERTGYLAETVEEYADAITQVLVMEQRDRLKIAAAAQRRAAFFSTQRFHDMFCDAIRHLLPHP